MSILCLNLYASCVEKTESFNGFALIGEGSKTKMRDPTQIINIILSDKHTSYDRKQEVNKNNLI